MNQLLGGITRNLCFKGQTEILTRPPGEGSVNLEFMPFQQANLHIAYANLLHSICNMLHAICLLNINNARDQLFSQRGLHPLGAKLEGVSKH